MGKAQDLTDAADAYQAARGELEYRRAVVSRAVAAAVAAGAVTQSEAARVAGVTRVTVRAWINENEGQS